MIKEQLKTITFFKKNFDLKESYFESDIIYLTCKHKDLFEVKVRYNTRNNIYKLSSKIIECDLTVQEDCGIDNFLNDINNIESSIIKLVEQMAEVIKEV